MQTLDRIDFKEQKTGKVAETRVGGYLCCGGEMRNAQDHFKEALHSQDQEARALPWPGTLPSLNPILPFLLKEPLPFG
jgi:hypothetical protein